MLGQGKGSFFFHLLHNNIAFSNKYHVNGSAQNFLMKFRKLHKLMKQHIRGFLLRAANVAIFSSLWLFVKILNANSQWVKEHVYHMLIAVEERN